MCAVNSWTLLDSFFWLIVVPKLVTRLFPISITGRWNLRQQVERIFLCIDRHSRFQMLCSLIEGFNLQAIGAGIRERYVDVYITFTSWSGFRASGIWKRDECDRWSTPLWLRQLHTVPNFGGLPEAGLEWFFFGICPENLTPLVTSIGQHSLIHRAIWKFADVPILIHDP